MMSQRARRVLGVVIIAIAVWGIGFEFAREKPMVPDTTEQFSLDLRVTESVDHDVIYAVEQRARPLYRIFSFDPRTGDTETIYTVPEGAVVYGIALSPDRTTLAIAFSPDFERDGNGLWTLDLATARMTQRTVVTPEVYLTEVAWAPDGDAVLATHVDRREADEQLAAVRVDLGTGVIETLATHAINPVQLGDEVFFLELAADKARRSIGVVDESGNASTLDVDTSGLDLDHLVADRGAGLLHVAVIEMAATAKTGITIGQPAGAHGNHDLPSMWWTIDPKRPAQSAAIGLEPIIVHDAAATPGAIVYATHEGLAIATTERIDVIKSRAVRFVAG